MLNSVRKIKEKIGDKLKYKRTYIAYVFNNAGVHVDSHEFDCNPIFLESEMSDYYNKFFSKIVKSIDVSIRKIGHEHTSLNINEESNTKKWYSVYMLYVNDKSTGLNVKYKIYVLDK